MVFDSATDALLTEYPARTPDRARVRSEWGLLPGAAIGELLVTPERTPFVNALLDEPLVLAEGQEAYLGETAEYDGEIVTD
jgi:hypothetical protein